MNFMNSRHSFSYKIIERIVDNGLLIVTNPILKKYVDFCQIYNYLNLDIEIR